MKTPCKFASLIGLLVVILSGCAERCDDFEYSITDWMPYKTNDRIIIESNNIIDSLTVNYSVINHTDKIQFGAKCICENSFSINLASANLDIYIRFDDAKDLTQSEIQLNDEFLAFSEQVNSAIIDGITYTNVLIFVNRNQESSANYQQVIVAKDIGIVAIISAEDEWVITDGSRRQVESSDIEFISLDC